jgi:iron(III) transport system substrate-binding protein
VTGRFTCRLLAVAVLLAAPGTSACGEGAYDVSKLPKAELTPYLEQLVGAARAEGALDLQYAASGTTDEINAWTAGFNHYYGLNLRIHNTQNPIQPTIASNLIEEARAGRKASTDVYFGVAVFVLQLEENGVAMKGALAGLPNLRGIAEDGDTAVTMGSDPAGITYNSQRVKGDNVPHTLVDVLKEPGSIHIGSTPYAGTLAALPQFWGNERAISYIVKLTAKLKGLFGCGEESRIVSGEFDMLVTDCGTHAARLLKSKGAPIDAVLPADGTLLNEVYLAIPTHTAHPAAAKLWVNYLLSRQAQDVFWQYDRFDSSRVPGSHMAPLIEKYRTSGIDMPDSDMAEARANLPWLGGANCVQALLNSRPNDPACQPFAAIIKSAGG